ncbi:MAG: RsmE family RNA methyltransferase, partial [Geobacter sp.]
MGCVCREKSERERIGEVTYFYVEPHKIQNGKILIEEQVYKHIVQVRRCREGDIIYVIDGTSREYQARIQSSEGRTCIAEVIQVKDRICESPVFLTLYQAMIKIPRFEIILEKSVELG